MSQPDSDAELELLEAEQARELELQLVASQGTLTDWQHWLARKVLWQASENRLALDPPHQGSRSADLPKPCLNTTKYLSFKTRLNVSKMSKFCLKCLNFV